MGAVREAVREANAERASAPSVQKLSLPYKAAHLPSFMQEQKALLPSKAARLPPFMQEQKAPSPI